MNAIAAHTLSPWQILLLAVVLTGLLLQKSKITRSLVLGLIARLEGWR
jgi:hypothetical protein